MTDRCVFYDRRAPKRVSESRRHYHQLLQRYGREHAELEDVVNKYHEAENNDRQLAEAQEMYESDDPEMRELAAEEIEHLKERKEHLLEETRIALLPKDIMDENEAERLARGTAGDTKRRRS